MLRSGILWYSGYKLRPTAPGPRGEIYRGLSIRAFIPATRPADLPPRKPSPLAQCSMQTAGKRISATRAKIIINRIFPSPPQFQMSYTRVRRIHSQESNSAGPGINTSFLRHRHGEGGLFVLAQSGILPLRGPRPRRKPVLSERLTCDQVL